MDKGKVITGGLRKAMLTMMVALPALALMFSCSSEDDFSAPTDKPDVVIQKNGVKLHLTLAGDIIVKGDAKATRGTARTDTNLVSSLGLYSMAYNNYADITTKTPNDANWEMVEDTAALNKGIQGVYESVNTLDGDSVPTSTDKVTPTENNMIYYIYYPYRSYTSTTGDLTLSSQTDIGKPEANYDVPTDVGAQEDFITGQSAARSTTVYKDTVNSVTIYHTLAQIRFMLKDVPDSVGIIRKITLSGVIGKGNIKLDRTSPSSNTYMQWDLSTDPADVKDFSVEPNYDVAVEFAKPTPDKLLNPGDSLMLLLPQTLGPTAQLKVYYERNGELFTFSKSIAGQKWEMGKVTTYVMSISEMMILQLDSQIIPWDTSYDPISSEIHEGSTIFPNSQINAWDVDPATGTTTVDETNRSS